MPPFCGGANNDKLCLKFGGGSADRRERAERDPTREAFNSPKDRAIERYFALYAYDNIIVNIAFFSGRVKWMRQLLSI